MIYINRINDFHRRAKAKRSFPRNEIGLDVCLYGYTIDARHLCKLIKRFKGKGRLLQEARLGPCTLMGDVSSYLAESFLLCSPNLKELDFSLEIPSSLSLQQQQQQQFERTSSGTVTDTTDTLSIIGEALNSCLQLETVRISKHCTILLPLLQNPNSSLQKITLEDYGATNEDLQRFYQSCQDSTTLHELIVRPVNADHFFSSGQIFALGQLIRQTTSLRILHIEDKNNFDFGVGWHPHLRLGQIHRQNNYLNANATNQDETTALKQPPVVRFDSLAQDLRCNQSLRRLTIDCGGWFTTQTAKLEEIDAFCDTLRQYNFTLEELDVTPRKLITSLRRPPMKNETECQTTEQILFLLSLNKMGRNRIWGQRKQQRQPSPQSSLFGSGAEAPSNNTNPNVWIDCIAKSSEAYDLSAIYFFLRNNPSLCQIMTTNVADVRMDHHLLKKQQQQQQQQGGVVVGAVVDAPSSSDDRRTAVLKRSLDDCYNPTTSCALPQDIVSHCSSAAAWSQTISNSSIGNIGSSSSSSKRLRTSPAEEGTTFDKVTHHQHDNHDSHHQHPPATGGYPPDLSFFI